METMTTMMTMMMMQWASHVRSLKKAREAIVILFIFTYYRDLNCSRTYLVRCMLASYVRRFCSRTTENNRRFKAWSEE